MPHLKYRRQRRVVGGRTPVSSGAIKEIEQRIEKEMRAYGVSRSFVIATALGYAFNIEEQEDYRKTDIKGNAIKNPPHHLRRVG